MSLADFATSTFAQGFPALREERRTSGIADRRVSLIGLRLARNDRRDNEYRRSTDRANFDVIRRNDMAAFEVPDGDG